MNYERQGDRRADWWCLSLKDGLTGIPIGIFQELVSRFCGLGLDGYGSGDAGEIACLRASARMNHERQSDRKADWWCLSCMDA